MIFYWKYWAHINLNIWPLCIWCSCKAEFNHKQSHFRDKSRASLWMAGWVLVRWSWPLGSVAGSLSISFQALVALLKKGKGIISLVRQTQHFCASFISLAHPYLLGQDPSLSLSLFFPCPLILLAGWQVPFLAAGWICGLETRPSPPIDWIFVLFPSQIHMAKPHPQSDSEWLYHEGRILKNRISALLKKRSQKTLLFLLPCKNTERRCCPWNKKWVFTGYQIYWYLYPGLTSLWNYGK